MKDIQGLPSRKIGSHYWRRFLQALPTLNFLFFFLLTNIKIVALLQNSTPTPFFYESFYSIVLVNRNQTNSSDKILESRKHSIKHSIVQSNTIILSKIILVTNFDHFFLKFLVHSTVLFDTSSIHSKLLARYYQRDKKNAAMTKSFLL